MNVRSPLQGPLRCTLLALIVLPALGTSAVAAGTSEVEGVWSFNGGAVGIQALSDGTFQGTVVSPTTFANCQHPAGEVMWTDMRSQVDGSFWGLHQWYQGTACEEVPVLGFTAWRVLETSSGVHILKVCFNTPGDGTQPTIAPDGKEANVTYGCVESSPLAPLPKVSEEGSGPGGGNSGGDSNGGGLNGNSNGGLGSGLITFSQAVVLPNAKACVSQSSLKIALKDPKYDPLKEVVVKIGHKKVVDVKGVRALKKGITLKKLPTGTYKISVVATTVLNQHLSGSQTYRSCTKSSGKIKLKRVKTHHHA